MRMSELRLDIPGIPPSVGHYNAYRVVSPFNGKPFVQCYPTKEAKAWCATVAAVAAGRSLRASSYVVSFAVYLANARRQDVDNFSKCLLDSLTQAGVITDDSAIADLHCYKRIDRANPRTVIVIRGVDEPLFAGAQ
jgi:Holliday junction resolvase RusA-like endonuclease